MSFEVTRDPRNRRGGWALIRVAAAEGTQTTVTVRRDNGEFALGPHGWQGGVHAFGPYTVEMDRRGTLVRIGPEIVNHMEEYLTVEIALPELGLVSTMPWPDEILPAPDAFEGGGVAARGPAVQAPTPSPPPVSTPQEPPAVQSPPPAPAPAPPPAPTPPPAAPTAIQPPPAPAPAPPPTPASSLTESRPVATPKPEPEPAPVPPPPVIPGPAQTPPARKKVSFVIPLILFLLLAATAAAGYYYYFMIYLPDQQWQETDPAPSQEGGDLGTDTEPEVPRQGDPLNPFSREPETGPTACTAPEIEAFLAEANLSIDALRAAEALCVAANNVDLRLDIMQRLLDLEDPQALLQWARWHDPARADEPSPVTRDPLTAADYYKRASAAGSLEALEALERFCTDLRNSSDPLASSLVALHCP